MPQLSIEKFIETQNQVAFGKDRRYSSKTKGRTEQNKDHIAQKTVYIDKKRKRPYRALFLLY